MLPSIRTVPTEEAEDGLLDAPRGNPKKGEAATLPCFPLGEDDPRVLPNAQGISLVLSEPRYMAMLEQVQEGARKIWARWAGCFAVTRAIRAEEEDEEPADGGAPGADDHDRPLRRGMLVRLAGLLGAPQLNGAIGKILRLRADTGRWEVDVEGRVGVKALKPENLERVPRGTPHKPFGAWRTPADLGGRWSFAEIGLVLHVDKMEEVKTMKKQGGEARSGYKVELSVVSRARLRKIQNPEALAGAPAFLRAEVEEFSDRDAEHPTPAEQEGMVKLLQELMQWPDSLGPALRIKMQLKVDVKEDGDVWKFVQLWQVFLHVRARLPKFTEAELQQFLQNPRPPPAITPAEFREIDRSMPLQQLIQADSPKERLRVFVLALEEERRRLEGGLEDISLFDALQQTDGHGRDRGGRWVSLSGPGGRGTPPDRKPHSKL